MSRTGRGRGKRKGQQRSICRKTAAGEEAAAVVAVQVSSGGAHGDEIPGFVNVTSTSHTKWASDRKREDIGPIGVGHGNFRGRALGRVDVERRGNTCRK